MRLLLILFYNVASSLRFGIIPCSYKANFRGYRARENGHLWENLRWRQYIALYRKNICGFRGCSLYCKRLPVNLGPCRLACKYSYPCCIYYIDTALDLRGKIDNNNINVRSHNHETRKCFENLPYNYGSYHIAIPS